MATLPSPPDDLTPEQLFLGHLDLIKRIIAHTCRQTRFKPQDTEDFGGYVMEKLIEGGYGRLRQFKGESKPETFLTVTIKRLLFDYRDHLWGKWRHSAEALRLGGAAPRLETLMVRDELTFSEAVHFLRNEGVDLPEPELWNLRTSLPPRIQRRFVGVGALQAETSREPPPDEEMELQEKAVKQRKIFAALYEELATLPQDDRLLTKMWLEMKVADIARKLGVEQKPLYRRIERIKEKLRKALERRGIEKKDIDDNFGP